jgi:hypothetical protein
MPEKIIVNGNLKELHSSGFEMRDGEPDIRGWKVKNNKNQLVGKVDELLFDTESLRIRYLVLDLEGKPLNLISRHLIIPIGLTQLDRPDKLVLLLEVTIGHLATLPEYKKGNVTIETERQVRNVFAPSEGVEFTDPDYYDPKEFYNNKYFDEERMYQQQISPADNTNIRNAPPHITRTDDEIKDEINDEENPY